MTVYQSANYANKTPAATGHGPYQVQTHLHAVSPLLPTSLATGDTIKMGTLPKNAVVVGCTLKAQSQLDSSTGLVFDVGDAGAVDRYIADTILVGRAAGASADTTLAVAGRLYKTTADTDIIVTVDTQATTAVAGIVELEMSYFVEDTTGSQA